MVRIQCLAAARLLFTQSVVSLGNVWSLHIAFYYSVADIEAGANLLYVKTHIILHIYDLS